MATFAPLRIHSARSDDLASMLLKGTLNQATLAALAGAGLHLRSKAHAQGGADSSEAASIATLADALHSDSTIDQPALRRLGKLYGTLDAALACCE